MHQVTYGPELKLVPLGIYFLKEIRFSFKIFSLYIRPRMLQYNIKYDRERERKKKKLMASIQKSDVVAQKCKIILGNF